MSINTIIAVKVYEKGMAYDTFAYSRIWITELLTDSILTYRTERGSRRRLDEVKVNVDPHIMAEFFGKLYNFVRTAEHCDTFCDDCEHRVTLYYSPCHKEVFEEMPYNGTTNLLSIIEDFVNKYGGAKP